MRSRWPNVTGSKLPAYTAIMSLMRWPQRCLKGGVGSGRLPGMRGASRWSPAFELAPECPGLSAVEGRRRQRGGAAGRCVSTWRHASGRRQYRPRPKDAAAIREGARNGYRIPHPHAVDVHLHLLLQLADGQPKMPVTRGTSNAPSRTRGTVPARIFARGLSDGLESATSIPAFSTLGVKGQRKRPLRVNVKLGRGGALARRSLDNMAPPRA